MRPAAELLGGVKLDYLFLECLAERTLAIAHARMASGGPGYDPRLPQWLASLLPICAETGCKLIANLGAADPKGGAAAAAFLVGQLGLRTLQGRPLKVVGVGEPSASQRLAGGGAAYVYLGADSVVKALEQGADVVITGRVADPSMVVGVVAYEFGWDLTDDRMADALATATCCGHLLECGHHLTGGFYFHPAGRLPPPPTHADGHGMASMGMPYAILRNGDADGCVGSGSFEVHRAHGTGGELSVNTCSQQLLYEVHDVGAYVTPDVVADFSSVRFTPLSPYAVRVDGVRASAPRPPTLLRLCATSAGVRQVGECSFGGVGCLTRSMWAEAQVKAWMEQELPGSSSCLIVSRPRLDALFYPGGGVKRRDAARCDEGVTRCEGGDRAGSDDGEAVPEVRLRFEGVFESAMGAAVLSQALGGLGVGGPAGACAGFMQASAFGQPVTSIAKQLVPRGDVQCGVWCVAPRIAHVAGAMLAVIKGQADPRLTAMAAKGAQAAAAAAKGAQAAAAAAKKAAEGSTAAVAPTASSPAHPSTGAALPAGALPAGSVVRLYDVCHSRAGDKGNTANVSLIAYEENASDFERVSAALTVDVLGRRFAPLLDPASASVLRIQIYRMQCLPALNVVLEPVLDGGVSVSRRLDPHGKSFSDLLLGLRFVVQPGGEWLSID